MVSSAEEHLSGGTEGTFLNTRGQRLFYRAYIAPGQPKAALVFQHGYGAHSGLYDEEYKEMQQAGVSVFAPDAAGFGKSEPSEEKYRCYVADVDHFADDIYAFRKEVVSQHCNSELPVFMGGMSMGGMIAVLTVLRDPSAWKGLVLLSPSINVPRTLTLRIMAAIQSVVLQLAPFWRIVPRPALEIVTADLALRERLKADPLMELGPVRVRTARTFLDGFAKIRQGQAGLDLPIFAGMSPTDQACDYNALVQFLKAVKTPKKDVHLLTMEGGLHELLMGPEHDETMAGMLKFILGVAAQ